MKRRLGGEKSSRYDQFRMRRWNPVPGNIHHEHPRREILFEHYVKRSYKASVTYWRLHPQEYSAMEATVRQNTKKVV